MTEVESIMSRELVSVAPGLPLQEAARRMSASHVGAALVLDAGGLGDGVEKPHRSGAFR